MAAVTADDPRASSFLDHENAQATRALLRNQLLASILPERDKHLARLRREVTQIDSAKVLVLGLHLLPIVLASLPPQPVEAGKLRVEAWRAG